MSAARIRHQALDLAASLPPLLLEAERVANAVNPGIHGRRRAGQGESFWQFRRYAPGDPAQQIDWRQSARTDKLFIREREWEATQTIYLWPDMSGSMHYSSSSSSPSKAERAQVLMLALASLLLRSGEKVVWLDKTATTIHGKSGLERIAAKIEPEMKGENLLPSLPVARHAHMILCSDFLMPPGDLASFLNRQSALSVRGTLIHILDPAEENLPFEGRIEMQGCENEVSLLLPNAGALRQAYHARMQEHKDRLMHIAESAGWFYLRHVTREQPHSALLSLFQHLSADNRGI